MALSTWLSAATAAAGLAGAALAAGAESRTPKALEAFLAGRFRWTLGAPLVAPVQRPGEHFFSIKDPSIVRYQGRWHLFCSIRGKKRSHQIEYCSFADWKDANRAPRHILKLSSGFFCAPQVFYYTPQKKWYLICQLADPARKMGYGAAYATTGKLADPDSWSPPEHLFPKKPENIKKLWLDFWVICDARKAHLFFTSCNGKLWRSETKRADFPRGWSQPSVVLRGDIFEASHTYRLKGINKKKFLTLIEAQARGGGRRYYKAYLAERLEGPWTPLAASRKRPFAAPLNVRESAPHWTDSFSHGELLRRGYDEQLEVDPARLRFLFQGVSDAEKKGKPYGRIPWKLSLLEPDSAR